MKKPAASTKTTSDTQGGRIPAPTLHVGREIADTTWRMTVPVVLFAFMGIFIDIRFHAAPWFTFVGVVIGFYFAVILIKKQIKRSEDSNE